MKHLEIKGIPFMANVLVATEPDTAYLSLPKDNIRELFRVDVNNQTLYFDFEDDDRAIVRIRKSFWKPIEISSWLLTHGEVFSLEMIRDSLRSVHVYEKEMLI
jgi:hypothetical protein